MACKYVQVIYTLYAETENKNGNNYFLVFGDTDSIFPERESVFKVCTSHHRLKLGCLNVWEK